MMLSRRVREITKEKAQLEVQVEQLHVLETEIEAKQCSRSLTELFKEKIRLPKKRATLSNPPKKEEKKREEKRNTCRRNEIHDCPDCVGTVDPMSLDLTLDGVCMRAVCYDRKSLQTLLKTQCDCGQHLHDPAIGAMLVKQVTPKMFGSDWLNSRTPS